MTAAPAPRSNALENEAHRAARLDPVLSEVRQRGLRALETILRAQQRGVLPVAVWNLETETLMFANDLYVQLFDIPTEAAACGTLTATRLLNTDAVFMHEDTRAKVRMTLRRYVRCKRELLAGLIPDRVARPFLCVTLTGRVQVRPSHNLLLHQLHRAHREFFFRAHPKPRLAPI